MLAEINRTTMTFARILTFIKLIKANIIPMISLWRATKEVIRSRAGKTNLRKTKWFLLLTEL